MGRYPHKQVNHQLLSGKSRSARSALFYYASLRKVNSMKSIKKRLLSLLLTLITILSLLPTSTLAASGTGKGITITKDQAYWSTRLLANGTPYSYRPPVGCCTASTADSATTTPRSHSLIPIPTLRLPMRMPTPCSRLLLPTAALVRWTPRRLPMSSGS